MFCTAPTPFEEFAALVVTPDVLVGIDCHRGDGSKQTLGITQTLVVDQKLVDGRVRLRAIPQVVATIDRGRRRVIVADVQREGSRVDGSRGVVDGELGKRCARPRRCVADQEDVPDGVCTCAGKR